MADPKRQLGAHEVGAQPTPEAQQAAQAFHQEAAQRGVSLAGVDWSRVASLLLQIVGEFRKAS